MIRYIQGKVLENEVNYILILTASGLGYRVYSTVDTCMSCEPDSTLKLYTYHHIREDAESLFGFINKADLEMFELLISVSGLGPKSALALLSANNINNIVSAIKQKSPELLNRAPGLGKKTLEKMILELSDKVDHINSSEISNSQNELRLALTSLGYTGKEIDTAIKNISRDLLDTDTDLNILLKEAFKYL